jgi:predicted permease
MRELLRRLSYLFRKRTREAELAEEIEFHRSMTNAAAFGSAALARNQSRDVWIPPWLQDIAQDLRFAARLLVKEPRFAFAASVALALGIGANTTVFTFINTVQFKGLPFAEPEQIVSIGTRDARGRDLPSSYAEFQDWHAAAGDLVQAMVATSQTTVNVSEPELPPERGRGGWVSAGTFETLRVAPILGRGFTAEDDQPGAPPVVVLGHDIWTSRYGANPAVVGREVRVNDRPAVIVGVMPKGFRFPMTAQLWQPVAQLPGLSTTRRDARSLGVTARLRPGVTAEQARLALTPVAERLAREYPDTNRGVAVTVSGPLDNARRFSRPLLLTMLGGVGFVLLIGCANIATLMLARAASRAREIAIRASLGATRWRIVRQLSIESILLSVIAGVIGLLLSQWGVRYFGVSFNAIEIGAPGAGVPPYWVDLSMDRTVFAFVAAISLGSSVLFGLAPALHISKADVNDVLKESGRAGGGVGRVRRWTSALMVAELALALVLLSGAGLLVRSFLAHISTNLVIEVGHLATARLTLPQEKYPTPEARKAFIAQLDERLAKRRGDVAASAAGDLPFVPLFAPSRTLEIDGRAPVPDEPPAGVSSVFVGARYFETLGLRPLQGRTFLPEDGRPGRESVVVSQRFAARFFPNEDPIGRRILLAGASRQVPPMPWMTIVGVVPTIPEVAIREPDAPLVYVPLEADPTPLRTIALLVRTNAAIGTVATWVRDDVRAIDATLPVYFVQPIDALIAQTRYPLRMMGTLFGLLAFIGVVLSAIGLSALTAHGVAARTQEIGVRMALGAESGQVVWLFLRRTIVQLAVGIALGLGGALSVGKLLQAYLVRTPPRDAVTLVSICVLLAAVALVAALVPARRAARVDPVVALRYE